MNLEVDFFDAYVDDPLLSAKEAAKYLGVCVTTFHKYRLMKKIPVVRFMGDLRVRRSDLNKFNQSCVTWGDLKAEGDK